MLALYGAGGLPLADGAPRELVVGWLIAAAFFASLWFM
jgi:hypothetical protein